MPSPTYQRIADDLRRAIVDGELPPGSKLPSRHELARQYEVSDRVAVEAVRLLVAEGFVEATAGSGSSGRHRPGMQRLTRSWYTHRNGGSPFRAAMAAAGRPGTWESSTERAPMTPPIAARLAARLVPGAHAGTPAQVPAAEGRPAESARWAGGKEEQR